MIISLNSSSIFLFLDNLETNLTELFWIYFKLKKRITLYFLKYENLSTINCLDFSDSNEYHCRKAKAHNQFNKVNVSSDQELNVNYRQIIKKFSKK